MNSNNMPAFDLSWGYGNNDAGANTYQPTSFGNEFSFMQDDTTVPINNTPLGIAGGNSRTMPMHGDLPAGYLVSRCLKLETKD
jgi:hypothetical protein